MVFSQAMKSYLQKHHRIAFYGFWLLLGLLQSGLTELQDDEAYYWVYSRFLDWGYFDHPPMIAVLVKAGYAIFPNELGVRLFPLLLNIGALMIIERLIDKKNPLLFYAIALSMAVIQLSGFVAVPDNPLIFFAALFFLCYKRFRDYPSQLNTILLGFSVALLLYSKYHAVLLVIFVLLSDRKLFKQYQVYLAGLIALVLFFPHLWWQYQHGWVSFKYHLFESNVNAYKPSFTINYILGQFLFPGPIAGLILLPAAFLYKPKNATEKALRYSMIGIYAFFLLSSLRGKVEGNWTSPALVAVIVLAHQYLDEKLTWQKWLYRLLPVTLILVLFTRVVMIADIVPVKAIKERYHAWKDWPAIMKEKTKGLPIVFSNSYQRASKYWFYTGQMTYSQNYYKERKNNYNYWPIEDSLLGKPVYFLDKYELWRFKDSLKTPLGWIGYKYDSSFVSLGRIQIEAEGDLTIKQGENLSLDCWYYIPPKHEQYILSHPQLDDTTVLAVFKGSKWIKDIPITDKLGAIVNGKRLSFGLNPELPKGKYILRLAIKAGAFYPTHNSEKLKLTVK